jgi:uncharacterized protein YyaL (SSP411 family)
VPNHLANENSPYLLQHANNPVDWYPWGEVALAKARQEDKPIFLSIGYAACHWCHVMAHESFEKPHTAAIMNENFVNIKVDREERPDLDSIYMNAIVAMTGQGGWPMSVFLTPDGKPFFGGTYYPPVRRYNMPSFEEVLLSIARAWRDDRSNVLETSEELGNHLKNSFEFHLISGRLDRKTLEEAAFRLAQGYDWKNGGWGKAPKFPQPMAIEFLLQRAVQGDTLAQDIATHALDAMSQGGMYDVIGGGFARYSTDDRWLVPHFEKMLYDNAQLATVYLQGFMITGKESYRQVCEKTLDFLVSEMMEQSNGESVSAGGFFSSLDADSDGEEGKYYTWTAKEIESLFPDAQDAELFKLAFGVTVVGNFEGANVLQRGPDDQALADRFDLPEETVTARLAEMRAKLYKNRQRRIHPGRDDKVLAAWNALALRAFAEAARYLQRSDYLEIARKNADFLLTELYLQGHLMRSWRGGQARHKAYLEDYAALILGLLALYQSDPDPWWFNSAVELVEEMLAHYRDPAGGFFDSSDDQESLIARPKDIQDNATPSGNALAALALLQLSAYTGQGDWRDIAEEMLVSLQEAAVRYPTAFSKWLCAIHFALTPTLEVAILGNPNDERTNQLTGVLWESYRPFLIAAISNFPPPSNAPALLHNRPLLNDLSSAYVCHNFVCRQPVNQPDDLRKQIETGLSADEVAKPAS